MRIILLLLISFSNVVCFFSQNEDINENYITCEAGIDAAVLSASKGEFVLMSFGLVVSIGNSDTDFYEFRDKYVLDKYGIRYENGGCVVTPYSKCYREKTEELLKEKFGKDILKVSKEEAINEFVKTDSYIRNYKRRVESDTVFSTYKVHSYPKFKGGIQALETYLSASTSPFEFEYGTEYYIVHFVIEKNGGISNIEIKSPEKETSINSKIKNKILSLFEDMPKWEPAIYFNKAVRVSESLSVVFRN